MRPTKELDWTDKARAASAALQVLRQLTVDCASCDLNILAHLLDVAELQASEDFQANLLRVPPGTRLKIMPEISNPKKRMMAAS